MAKQIYIDENGNEQLVSGTINNAELLPIQSGSATNTKDYIDSKANEVEITPTPATKMTAHVTKCWRKGKTLYFNSAFKSNTGWVGGNDTVFTISGLNVVNETYFPCCTSDGTAYGYMSFRNNESDIEVRIATTIGATYIACNATALLT